MEEIEPNDKGKTFEDQIKKEETLFEISANHCCKVELLH